MVDKKALKNTNTHYIHTTGDKTESRGERTTRKPKKTKKKNRRKEQEKVVTLTIAQEKKNRCSSIRHCVFDHEKPRRGEKKYDKNKKKKQNEARHNYYYGSHVRTGKKNQTKKNNTETKILIASMLNVTRFTR